MKKKAVKAWLVSVALAFSAATVAAQAVEYRHAPDALVVKLTEVLGGIEGGESGPSLAIYGDGRAVVRRPAYMKNAGERTFVVGPAELDRLVTSLAANGVPDFDADGVRAAKRAALQARLSARAADRPVTVRTDTDASTTVIELHLERYQPPGARAATRVDREISWYALATDAEEHPDLVAIRKLAAAREELLAIMRRADGATAR